MPNNIIRIGAEYAAEIASLNEQCFSEPDSESTVKSLMKDPMMTFFAVIEEGRALAYCSFAIVAGEIQIVNVATSPEHRGKGYAKMLVKAALECAASAGCAQGFLEVRESNAAAIKAYSAAGFAVAGRRRAFYRLPTEDALVMSVSL